MYKSAVVDYARNNAQSTSGYYVNGTEEFNATLDSVFSSVWAGEETMEEAISENLEELQALSLIHIFSCQSDEKAVAFGARFSFMNIPCSNFA